MTFAPNYIRRIQADLDNILNDDSDNEHDEWVLLNFYIFFRNESVRYFNDFFILYSFEGFKLKQWINNLLE